MPDISKMVQLIKRPSISGLRPDAAGCHEFLQARMEWVHEPVVVPRIEQGHVETEMRRVEPVVHTADFKKSPKMEDEVCLHSGGGLVVDR